MKAQDYQAFVEQLNALTPAQREALLAAYLGWRRMIERDNARITPHHMLAAAIRA